MLRFESLLRLLVASLATSSFLTAQSNQRPRLESISLFDGRSLNGWKSSDGSEKITGWTVEDDAIVTIPGTVSANDLVSNMMFTDFELTFSIRLSPGANSGVKYMVNTGLHYLMTIVSKGSGAIGLEMQLADDEAPDARSPLTKSGALYGILQRQESVPTPPGVWIPVKLKCLQMRCEHWLNDRKVLSFDLKSPEVQAKLREAAIDPARSVSSSVAASMALRASERNYNTGRIALQHHDTRVWFRDLRMRQLQP